MQLADAGRYRVIVSNVAGMYSSEVVSLTVLPHVSLAEALDAPSVEWRTGTSRHSRPWMGQTNVTHDGRDAALGSLRDGECWLETTVTGPGLLSFWWAVSVPAEFGRLSLAMDGAGGASIAGNVEWARQSLVVPHGPHVLRWSFTNDNHYASASAWVDQVQFTGTATNPPWIVLQPVTQTRFVGQTATFTVEATGMAPLAYQWQKNGASLGGQTNAVLHFPKVQLADAGRYRVLVSNTAGSVTSTEATLTVLPVPAGAGSLDITFDPTGGGERVGLSSIHDAVVYAVAALPEGKAVIGGRFSSMDGVPRNNVARLHPDGSLDASFDPGWGTDGDVRCVGLQGDGKVVIGGEFTTVNGERRNEVAQLLPDGALDADFEPILELDGYVRTVAAQPDGKVLLGGCFKHVNGLACTNLARLNRDGSVDANFVPRVAWDDALAASTHCSCGPMGRFSWPAPLASRSKVSSDSTRTGRSIRVSRAHRFARPKAATSMAAWRASPLLRTVRSPSRAASGTWTGCCRSLWRGSTRMARVTRALTPAPAAARPGAGAKAFAVEEVIPPGWSVSTINANGEFDAASGKVKWGPFFESAPRTLSYQAVPPASASGAVAFTGVASFDGASIAVTGARHICAGSRLRVALNPATGRLALNLAGPIGNRHLIESSTDLARWLPLTAITASPDGVAVLLDSSLGEPQQFYRARRIE